MLGLRDVRGVEDVADALLVSLATQTLPVFTRAARAGFDKIFVGGVNIGMRTREQWIIAIPRLKLFSGYDIL